MPVLTEGRKEQNKVYEESRVRVNKYLQHKEAVYGPDQ